MAMGVMVMVMGVIFEPLGSLEQRNRATALLFH